MGPLGLRSPVMITFYGVPAMPGTVLRAGDTLSYLILIAAS